MEKGDIVKVIDTGKVYSSYEDWINENGKKYKNKWLKDRSITDTGSKYKILEKNIHSKFNDTVLCLVQNLSNQDVYIIDENGLKQVDEYKIIIIGKLNQNEKCNYWLCELELKEDDIGDYAIVENKTDYDIVKIIGITKTKKEFLKNMSYGEPYKKVIKIIKKEYLKEENNGASIY